MENSNEIQIINQQEVLGKNFTVYGTFENPLFLAKDVAEWIEHSNPTEMLRGIDEEEKLLLTIFRAGQNRLFSWLRENGYLCSRGESYNQPTQRAMDLGIFEMKKSYIQLPDGTSQVTFTTKVTGRGQIYFVNKFLPVQHRKEGKYEQQK